MSEQIEPKVRQKPGPKPKLPKVSVMERRKLNPFGSPSVPITLKTPGLWAIRIVHSTVRPGRLHDMTSNKGWAYVRPAELDGTPDEIGFRAVDDRLVRGEKGEEVLMKMPQADYDEIQDSKSRLNLKNLGQKQTREAVAQTTAQQFGPEAGDQVFGSMELEVKDSREQVELDPEPA